MVEHFWMLLRLGRPRCAYSYKHSSWPSLTPLAVFISSQNFNHSMLRDPASPNTPESLYPRKRGLPSIFRKVEILQGRCVIGASPRPHSHSRTRQSNLSRASGVCDLCRHRWVIRVCPGAKVTACARADGFSQWRQVGGLCSSCSRTSPTREYSCGVAIHSTGE